MNRLREFLRSVLPADLAQLLFLFGVVCLVIAPRIRWLPSGWHANANLRNGLGNFLELSGGFFVWPIVFAGVAGYYTCFWPGTRPARRIFLLVCVPALAGMSLLLARIFYLSEQAYSVLESGHYWKTYSILWKSAGLHFGLLGLLLIGIFLGKLTFQKTSLPLSLLEMPDVSVHDPASWGRLLFLIWFLIGPLFLCSSLVALLSFAIALRVPGGFYHLQDPWFQNLSLVAGTGLAFGIALVFIGKDERQAIRKTLRWPGEKYLLLALFFPVAAALALSLGEYAYERSEWAIYSAGRVDAPEFASYFHLPDPWLFLLFFPAFFEELIFRGLLQPNFIQRYGQYRGIALVGLVWSAFHFFSDFSFSHADDLTALQILLFRMFVCITLSFVLGWLVLHSGSVFPAAIAHTLYNLVVSSNHGSLFTGSAAIYVSLWAILAVLAYRHSPPIISAPEQLEKVLSAT